LKDYIFKGGSLCIAREQSFVFRGGYFYRLPFKRLPTSNFNFLISN